MKTLVSSAPFALILGSALFIGCERGQVAVEENASDQPASEPARPEPTPEKAEPTQEEKPTEIPTQRVAVVDANRAMKGLGLTTQINNQLQAVRIKHQPKLQKIVTAYQEKYETKQKEVGQNPTEEQEKELQAILQQRDGTLRQAQIGVEQEIANLQKSLMSQARGILRPAIKRVAEKRGYTLVINGDIAYSAAEDDITEDVIFDAREFADHIKKLKPPPL